MKAEENRMSHKDSLRRILMKTEISMIFILLIIQAMTNYCMVVKTWMNRELRL